MKIKMKYKDVLYETIGETSMDNTWQFIGISLSDLFFYGYDEIEGNENAYKLNKSSFVYDGDINIEIDKHYFPIPIYMPTSDDFEIPHCNSSGFDMSKMKIYIKYSLINNLSTGLYQISKIEYEDNVVYRNLFLDYF